MTIAQAAFMVHVSMGAIEAHLSSSAHADSDRSERSFSVLSPRAVSVWRGGVWVMGRETDILGIHQTDVGCHSSTHAVQCTQMGIKHALTGERGPVAVLYHSQALRGRISPNSRPPLYTTEPFLPGPTAGPILQPWKKQQRYS